MSMFAAIKLTHDNSRTGWSLIFFFPHKSAMEALCVCVHMHISFDPAIQGCGQKGDYTEMPCPFVEKLKKRERYR